uniref:Odorant-binding protein n=1 Tax=Anoplophora chinensis TaxID=217632 RepID=A0A2H4ZB12_ANOCN|nr:odorant-binding protein [Anoplophora chinensis]
MNNVVAFCALLVATVSAYNFEDPDFNILLSDDLEELSSGVASFSHPRSRRDDEAVNDKDKCHHRKRWGELCCAEDVVAKMRDVEKDLKRECFKEVVGKDKHDKFDPFNCETMDQRKKQIVCVIECVGKKKDLLDTEGNPKEEEFRSFLKESFSSESWLAALQDKVISTCLDEGKNATANRDASDSTSCNPAGIKIAHCLHREIQLNCPADQIKDEKSCARLQERLKRRDFFHPPPPPGGFDEPDN